MPARKGAAAGHWRVILPALLGMAGSIAAGLAAGVFFGDRVGGAVTALLLSAMLLSMLRHILRLVGWLSEPSLDTVPTAATGSCWAMVYGMLRESQHEFEKSARRLQARENRYRKTLSALPDGIVLVKSDWEIDWCNEAAENQLGIDPERDEGKMITEVFRAEGFSEYLAAGEFDKPVLVRHAPMDRTLELWVLLLGRRNGVVVSHDITDRDRIDSVRRDFVANVSHELRTPLTVINGFLDLAVESGGAPLERSHLELMRQQAGRMKSLVTDLLTLSKLEGLSERAEEAFSPVDVPEIAAEAVREGRALSAGRHEIGLDCAQFGFMGKADQIKSALTNLVSNAVRYTPAGGHIRVAWRERGGFLELLVADDGIGIAAEHIPRVTERFYRVDKSRSRDTGGTGLGLAIVKHVVLRQGGTLLIESEPERGSTFTMRFPGARKCAI